MSDVKVSQLAAATAANQDDSFMVVQNGVSKKVTLTTLLHNLNSSADIRINPNQKTISLIISSKTVTNLFVVDGVNEKVGVGTATPQEIFHVAGNQYVSGVYRGSVETISTSGSVVSTVIETTSLDMTGVNTYSLADGYEGQTKFIYTSSVGSGATGAISVNGLGFTTISFSTAAGRGISLKFANGKWICVGNNGAVLT